MYAQYLPGVVVSNAEVEGLGPVVVKDGCVCPVVVTSAADDVVPDVEGTDAAGVWPGEVGTAADGVVPDVEGTDAAGVWPGVVGTAADGVVPDVEGTDAAGV